MNYEEIIYFVGGNMLKVFNIKEKQEYLREVAMLTQREWGSKTNSE